MKISISFLTLLVTIPLCAQVLTGGSWKISGYRKQLNSDGKKIEILAGGASGWATVSDEVLLDAVTSIESGDSKLRFNANKLYLSKSEFSLVEKWWFEFYRKEKLVFRLEASEDSSQGLLTLSDDSLRANSGKLTLNGRNWQGRGLSIDFKKSEINWIGEVRDSKGRKRKTPLRMAF